MTADPYNVLFLCRQNAARSILAESILAREGGGRFRAFSAGSEPRGEVAPETLTFLDGLGFPTAHLRSKSWDEFTGPAAPRLDFVFTVCGATAEEVCPVWPGRPVTANWAVPDPLAVEGTRAERYAVFAEVARMLTNRISVFTQLPLAALDRLALSARLDAIGVAGAATGADGPEPA